VRRRTKPKVAWLPKDTRFTIQDTNVLALELDVVATGVGVPVTTGVVAVVLDQTPDPTVAKTTLADMEGGGYRLRRIVGKCFVEVEQNAESIGPILILVAGAFIILRTDRNTEDPQNTDIAAYDLFNVQNDDHPWIWRREWILQNGSAQTAITADWPHTSAEYGSVSDGSHIDQKTARIIGPDERLFFVASAMPLVPGTGGAQDETKVKIRVTPRVLGSMRTTVGNRRNASR